MVVGWDAPGIIGQDVKHIDKVQVSLRDEHHGCGGDDTKRGQKMESECSEGHTEDPVPATREEETENADVTTIWPVGVYFGK